jgi:hypothetical protein
MKYIAVFLTMFRLNGPPSPLQRNVILKKTMASIERKPRMWHIRGIKGEALRAGSRSRLQRALDNNDAVGVRP